MSLGTHAAYIGHILRSADIQRPDRRVRGAGLVGSSGEHFFGPPATGLGARGDLAVRCLQELRIFYQVSLKGRTSTSNVQADFGCVATWYTVAAMSLGRSFASSPPCSSVPMPPSTISKAT